jgi:HK97 family phage major capsid protein
MLITEQREAVAALKAEVTALADADPAEMTADLEARFEYALVEFDAAKAELTKAETRAAKVAEVRATVTETTDGHDFSTRKAGQPVDLRNSKPRELRDAALKLVEDEGTTLSPRQLDHVDALLRGRQPGCDSTVIAQMVIASESDAYRSGFQKAMTGNEHRITAEENAARIAFDEVRAASEGTSSAGGFGIPVLIDPSIILTSGAVDAPVLALSRSVTITTDAWKGVTSAGVSWSYDAEGSAVSDDTPTLAQPAITVYAARGFIPYSIEIGQDYPGFAEEMATLMSQGYVDLLASQTVVGSGSSSPRGIFTAMAAVTTSPAHSTLTTAGTIGGADLRTLWSKLPERFRSNATFLLSPNVDSQIRGLGNNLAMSDYTVNLLADGTSTLFGRPVVLSDYAPSFTNTTGAESVLVAGDFSKGFLIVNRAGMTVEPVQHLFDTSTGRPTGSRGWFAYARHGFDIVNANAFRLLSNT